MANQRAYAKYGTALDYDEDLISDNYVCRGQETGLEKSAEIGWGVLMIKALSRQWISWLEKTKTVWPKTILVEIIRLNSTWRRDALKFGIGLS